MNTAHQLVNPWNKLPMTAPFILSEDRAIVEGINLTAQPRKQVRLEVLPVPFLGSLAAANIVLLALNPGFDDQELQTFANDPGYVRENRTTLTFHTNPSFFITGNVYPVLSLPFQRIRSAGSNSPVTTLQLLSCSTSDGIAKDDCCDEK